MHASIEHFAESLVLTDNETENQYFHKDQLSDYTANYLNCNGSSEMSKVPPEAELEQIMQGIKSGDRASMEQFFRKMYPSLFAYTARMVGQEEAEEVVNDVMFEVWKSAPSFKGDSKISTWVFGITRNWCFKTYQSKSALKRSQVTAVEQSELEMHEDSLDEIANIGTFDEIEKLLDQLSDQHRSALLLVVEGYSDQEIAQIEDCPENTARTRVFNARKQLQKLLVSAQRQTRLKP